VSGVSNAAFHCPAFKRFCQNTFCLLLGVLSPRMSPGQITLILR
jgi:hypothetical protein